MLFFMSLFLLSLFLLFGSLWALHTYLLASSQTTYEVLKGASAVTGSAMCLKCMPSALQGRLTFTHVVHPYMQGSQCRTSAHSMPCEFVPADVSHALHAIQLCDQPHLSSTSAHT